VAQKNIILYFDTQKKTISYICHQTYDKKDDRRIKGKNKVKKEYR
jgi:hypothetical protein